MSRQPDHADMAEILRVLGHPTRLTILRSLARGERSVGEIAEATGLVQPALSQQLALLRKAALVSTRREAKQIFYALNPGTIGLVQRLLESLVTGEGVAAAGKDDGSGLARVGAAVFARLAPDGN